MSKVDFLHIDYEEASTLVAGRECSLFQEPLWWSVLKDGFCVYCWALEIIEDGSPIAILPVFERKISFFLRLIGSPLRGTFTPYIGLITLKDITSKQYSSYIADAFKFLRSYGSDYISFGFKMDDEFDGNLPSATTWLIESPGTFILDIEPNEEVMWRRISGRGRNMVRKAKKKGVIVRRLTGTPEEITLFYEMLVGTFAKSGLRPPHPVQFYEALVRYLMPAQKLLFLAAEFEGNIIAMGLFPYNKREIHYLSGTSLPEAGKVAANNLIQWEVIRFAAMQNIKLYDLGGVGIPSIDKFKASFGARIVQYQHYTWLTPKARIAYYLYMKWRKFWQKNRLRI